VELTTAERECVGSVKSQIPTMEKTEFSVDFKAFGETSGRFKSLKTILKKDERDAPRNKAGFLW
jgi:hypothetical protein